MATPPDHVGPVVPDDCPIMGLGSFGTRPFLAQKALPMHGNVHSRSIPRVASYVAPVNELVRVTVAWAARRRSGSACAGYCLIYSVVKDQRRERQDK